MTVFLYALPHSSKKRIYNCKDNGYPSYNCKRENITPFIDLNPRHTGYFTYKDASSTRIEFLSAKGAYVCTKIGMKLPSTGENTVAQNQTINRDVFVISLTPLSTTAEHYTSILEIIRGYLTHHQETVTHGKRNMM